MPEAVVDQQQQSGQGQGDSGQGTGQGAGQGTSQPGTGAPNGQGQQGQGQSGDATRTGAPSGFVYQEDRSKWIPPHRFNEVSQKAKQVDDLTAKLAEAENRVRALAGVAPTDAARDRVENIKAAILEVMPELKPFIELTPEQREALLKTPDFLARNQSAEQRAWQRHGGQQIRSIGERIAEALNVDKLDDDQIGDVRESFAAWLRQKATAELEASEGQESKTLDRYENADETLLDEFVTRYTKNWVDPARRTGVARTVNRTRPVPSSSGRQAVSTIKRPDKFNSLDERIEYAANLAKERGVQFGR